MVGVVFNVPHFSKGFLFETGGRLESKALSAFGTDIISLDWRAVDPIPSVFQPLLLLSCYSQIIVGLHHLNIGFAVKERVRLNFRWNEEYFPYYRVIQLLGH
jgi:hypothetical protein